MQDTRQQSVGKRVDTVEAWRVNVRRGVNSADLWSSSN